MVSSCLVGCSFSTDDSTVRVEARSGAANGSSLPTAEDQYGFLSDLSKCVNCKQCVVACRKGNMLTDDTPDRRRVSVYLDKKRKNVSLSTSCMHCGTPSCVQVCPAAAISKDEGGIVLVDTNLCIGCKYCFHACPYGVPRYNSKAMDKCDCCIGADVPIGDTPYCVQACKFSALQYGKVSELLRGIEEKTVPVAEVNDPSCYLIQ